MELKTITFRRLCEHKTLPLTRLNNETKSENTSLLSTHNTIYFVMSMPVLPIMVNIDGI